MVYYIKLSGKDGLKGQGALVRPVVSAPHEGPHPPKALADM